MKLIIIVLCLIAQPSRAQDSHDGHDHSNIQTSGNVDFYLPIQVWPEDVSQNRLKIREAEVALSGTVDKTFEGYLSLSAHDEAGVLNAELHEAYLRSNRLIPLLRIQVGHFLLPFGELGSTHRHEWPFISAPKIFTTVFDDHGVIDSGVSFNYLLPTTTVADVTFGVSNGYHWGHTHSGGRRPVVPTHYLQISVGHDIGQWYQQLGAAHIARQSWDRTRQDISLLTLRWQKGSLAQLQSEFYFQSLKFASQLYQEVAGFYIYPEIQVSDLWWTGVRLDGFTELNRQFLNGDTRPNFDYALSPQVSFQLSDDSRMRFGYTYTVNTQQGSDDIYNHLVELQLVNSLGAHSH